ncbi:CBS domain-containing protein [Pseudonocardia acaciae]|uniref:CBS domain-containing protein n=1 Tax=Pseudonocardia acaciae TaxID=551276 RepID=UPI000686645B|nr:CBS domain-containing protein [Pseudonocardia acaciae]
MKARDLAQQLPTISMDDSAYEAAQLIAGERLPALAVFAADGRPVTVLPASDVLRAVIPGPILEDPSLAGVIDEQGAEACADELGRKRVRDLIRPERHRVELAVVDGDDTVVECAATMARLRSPLLVVTDPADRHRVLGLLTASRLLAALLERLPAPTQPTTK